MRQIGSLPDAETARKLADYLATLAIETRLDAEGDGWAVWACDEDRVPQAKQVFAEFAADPKNARFRAPARRVVPLPEAPEEPRAAPRPAGPDPLEQPAPARPPLTLALIFACVLVAVLTSFGGSGLLGERPDREETPGWLIQLLSISSYDIVRRDGQTWVEWHEYGDLGQVKRGEVWRLVTPIFIHLSPVHLLLNMLALRLLGGMIEVRRGWWMLALLVVVFAVPSNLAQYSMYYLKDVKWLQGLNLGGGPAFGGFSGVLYGLFGYIWIKGRLQPEQGLAASNTLVVGSLVWFILCFTGLVGPIGNTAHTVGLLAGMLLAWLSYLLSRVFG
jgi:GlpG protein